MSNTTNIQTEDTSLSERVKERQQEQQKEQIPAQKSDDSDLGYELHEEFEHQKNNNAHSWRFG